MTPDCESAQQRRRTRLLFRVRKSIRYHDIRRAFLSYVEGSVKVLGLVIGSAVFTKNFGGHVWVDWLALVFVALTALTIVRRYGYQHYLHDSLYKEFVTLEKKFLDVPEEPSEEALNGIEKDILSAEFREPPLYSALNRYCHNEVVRVYRYDADEEDLKWFHPYLMNFFKFKNLPGAKPATAR